MADELESIFEQNKAKVKNCFLSAEWQQNGQFHIFIFFLTSIYIQDVNLKKESLKKVLVGPFKSSRAVTGNHFFFYLNVGQGPISPDFSVLIQAFGAYFAWHSPIREN